MGGEKGSETLYLQNVDVGRFCCITSFFFFEFGIELLMSCCVKPCLLFFPSPGEGINEIMVGEGDKKKIRCGYCDGMKMKGG